MRRIGAVLLLTAALLLAAAGCQDAVSRSKMDQASAETPADAPDSGGEDVEAAEEQAGAVCEEGQQAASSEEPTEDAEGSSTADGHDTAAGPEEEPAGLPGEILPQSDDRPLESSDFMGLTNWELTLARNEIYARHGRPFQNPDIRKHFEQMDWYSPDPDFNKAWLSLLERKNVDSILNHQNLSFGRPATHPGPHD